MKPTKLQSSAHSLASVTEMWRLLCDVERWAEMLPTMTSVEAMQTAGPPAAGSRYRVRQPGLAPAVYEITEWHPQEGFVWAACTVGLVTTARHAISGVETGSQLELEIEWSGPLSPIIRRFYGRKALQMIETEATTFAHLANVD